MGDATVDEPIFLLILSTLIVLAMAIKAVAPRVFKVPPAVGYIVLGIALRAVDNRWEILPAPAHWTLGFAAEVGVAALLFHVGVRSDVRGLLEQLPRAARIWIVNVIVCAGAGIAMALALNLGMIPALFIGAALTATSVGISVVVWEDAGRLRSRLGELLVDVAELDDISAILLMLAVVTVAPLMRDGGSIDALLIAATTSVGSMLVKVALFATACWLFARYVEHPFTKLLQRSERPPDRLLSIVGVSFAVAAIAGAIGFSVAVGALFAGLMFSRDPIAVHEEASFSSVYALVTPFFFIDVGYAIDPTLLGESIGLGLLLLVPAVLGKIVGVGVPVAFWYGGRAGAVMGVSMLPRAEIALLIAHTGNQLGPWAMPDAVFGGMVVASAIASISSPLALRAMFKRWPGVTEVDETSENDDDTAGEESIA